MVYLILCLGLLALFLGGDWLVKGASGIANRFGVSPMIIGLTIVGFGTSTPELLVSLNAALGGQPGIAIGNVVGSNIANILLILGIAAVIGPMAIRFADIRWDLGWMAGAALMSPFVFWSGHVGRIEGFVMMSALCAYLAISLRGSTTSTSDGPSPSKLWTSVGLTLLGLVTIMGGAHYLVQSATIVARQFGISEAMIGLSIVAIGTSLPELATTIVAALRGQRDIAVGNVIGSNIFNVFAILGMTALVAPVPVAERFMTTDVPILIVVTLALGLLISITGRIGRFAGVTMLVGYAAYIGLTASF